MGDLIYAIIRLMDFSSIKIGILSILIPAVIWGIMNLVYGIEAMKKSKLNIE